MINQYYATTPISLFQKYLLSSESTSHFHRIDTVKMIQASSWQRRFETLALTLSGLSDALHTAIASAYIPRTIEISGFGKLEDVLTLLIRRTKPEHSMINRRVKPRTEDMESAGADLGPRQPLLVSESVPGEAKRGEASGSGGPMYPDANIHGEPSNAATPIENILDHHLSEHHSADYMAVTYENMDLTESQLVPLTTLLQKVRTEHSRGRQSRLFDVVRKLTLR